MADASLTSILIFSLLVVSTHSIIEDSPPGEWQNKVFAVGDNFFGQLGTNDRARSADVRLVSELYEQRNVTKIAACDYSSFAITYVEEEEVLMEEGRLYAWGRNTYGQLGLGNRQSQVRPRLVAALSHVIVKDVACARVPAGASHTLSVDEDGNVYAWGYNLYGQLGLGDTKMRNTPELVPFPAGVSISKVYCGGYHSVAISTSGVVYVWGQDTHGQLGIPASLQPVVVDSITGQPTMLKYVDTPFELTPALALSSNSVVRGLSTFADAALGMYFTLLMSTSRHLIASGSNEKGQLGVGDYIDRDEFEKVAGNAGALSEFITAGHAHVIVCGRAEVWGWGDNEYGQAGVSPANATSIPSPFQLDVPAAFFDNIQYNNPSLAAGMYHTVYVSAAGEVFSWGFGQHGQLASGNYNSSFNTSFAGSPSLDYIHTLIIENDVINRTESIIFVEASAGALHTLLRTDSQNCGTDPRFGLQCNGNGWCNVDSGVCHCDYPYTNEVEEAFPTCGPSSQWCPNRCSGHGVCDKGTCLCELEFQTYSDCSIGSCVDNCTSIYNGLCNTDEAECVCVTNATHQYEGVACETRNDGWDVQPIDYNKYDARFPGLVATDAAGGKYTTTEYTDEEYSLSFPTFVEDGSTTTTSAAPRWYWQWYAVVASVATALSLLFPPTLALQ
eukprot:CAMPEP_0113876052 /NCGR_PEP_ID=MMETSP0780_2-20120614/5273_1 /TAXON_ID=652834 /ORGANISM="Palpitomonas bilix" /LENGTH=670 /DNA_ID=CAMNT_0000862089 /DNA_START=328 /DNA_END=2340 /DNA_ORIENTATION=- /assembly_acc=CAM_ASM_000599